MIVERTYFRELLFALTLGACVALGSAAAADDSHKEQCLEAHSRGQDAKTQGKITLARKLFMTCAQSSCPSLVQSDCARYADELERVQPTLSFAARDGRGHDLPDTTVYVDDALVVTRVDDGKPHEVDPGKHVVRFVNGGREKTVTLVVQSGEKGRSVVGSFESLDEGDGEGGEGASAELEEPEVHHALGARVLLGTGVGLVAGGVALGVVGLSKVPENCSMSTNECSAPPGDASFGKAEKAVRLNNIGWSVGGVGLAALTTGLIWYFKSATTESERQTPEVVPFATPEAAGLAITGRL